MSRATGPIVWSSAASSFREEVFQEDDRRACIEVVGTASRGLGGGETLVDELRRQAQGAGGLGEGPHALRLMADLATGIERKSDHDGSDVLLRDDLPQGVEIRGDATPPDRPQRSRETERFLTHGEADRAVTDVERKITHGSGRPGGGAGFGLDLDA